MTSYPPPGQSPPPPAGPPLPPPYGAPVPPSYGAPPQQPYGAPAPPPVAPDTSTAVKAPIVAWLVPLAALLAVIGAFTPWFRPKATVSGHSESTTNALYSFEDGKIGLLAPILLVVLAIGFVGLLIGKAPTRFTKGSGHPVAAAGKAALIVGGVSLVCAVIGWFLVKSQYKFPGPNGTNLGWDDFIKAAKDLGVNVKLSQGPQIGYFLTVAAALLAIIGGILMILAARGKPVLTPYGRMNLGGTQGTVPGGSGASSPAGQVPDGQAPGGFGPPPGGHSPQSGPPAPQGPPPPR